MRRFVEQADRGQCTLLPECIAGLEILAYDWLTGLDRSRRPGVGRNGQELTNDVH
jgi:hypothetical protein